MFKYHSILPLLFGIQPIVARDRYAKEGSGVYLGLCAMLLCRCAMGQVLTVPDARDTREVRMKTHMRLYGVLYIIHYCMI